MTHTGVAELDVASAITRYLPLPSLEPYHEELMARNKLVNLVSRETSRADFDRLVAESLYPLQFLSKTRFRNYLDIGSGGGLPAIPILMAKLVTGQSVLCERTLKKARMLVEIVSALSLNAKVESHTVEELKLDIKFDLITLRAVTLTPQLATKIVPFMSPDGCFVYYSSQPATFPLALFRSESHQYVVKGQAVTKHFTVFRIS